MNLCIKLKVIITKRNNSKSRHQALPSLTLKIGIKHTRTKIVCRKTV